MDKPMEHYWDLRLNELKKSLETNNFEVHLAADTDDAKKIVLEEILPKIEAKSVSWGGSMTFVATGLYHLLKDNPDFDVIDTYDQTLSMKESMERRRQSLLADLYFVGSNAVIETGNLVNLDMLGNLLFGQQGLIREPSYRLQFQTAAFSHRNDVGTHALPQSLMRHGNHCCFFYIGVV